MASVTTACGAGQGQDALPPAPKTPADLRALCPGATSGVYLDVAARGLISRRTVAAAEGYLARRSQGRTLKDQLFATVETCRARAAQLIGAAPGEIAFTQNVSEGINAIANAIDWRAGDNVVLCSALEHPANLYPWLNLARRLGVEIRSVPATEGRLPLAALLAQIDGRTRAVTLASVSFAPGFRADLAALGAECRRRGVISVVDGAQSAGILATDVAAEPIDVLAVSGQKGLMAPYGIGFTYVRAEIAERLTPVYMSRMGVDDLSGHEASSGDLWGWRPAPGARRFDVGNFNYLGATALAQSLEDLLAIGPRVIEAHSLALARQLSQGLAELGLPVFAPPSAAEASHIVAVGREISDSHDATSDRGLARLYDWLGAGGVSLTIRRGMLRFSCHGYNAPEDIAQVVDLAREFLRRPA